MLKKKFRLTDNRDFSSLITKKKQIANKQFVLYYNQNKNTNIRIGISVSKKIGSAVVRNQIKRQISHMSKDVFNLKENCDYLIIVRKNYLAQSYLENKKDLEKIYKKVKMKEIEK